MLDAALASASDAFIGMDAYGRITAWNKAAATLFGWSRNEAVGRKLSETIIPQRYRHAHDQAVHNFNESRTSSMIGELNESSGLHRDGHEIPIEITRWWLREGDRINFYAFVRDISQRKVQQYELERQAYYDSLTGLPNRLLLQDRLEQLLARRDVQRRGPALLFVDLDRFKRINDTLGHAAGDHILVTVANRLQKAVRPMDAVARLAGDEFIIVCPDISRCRDAGVIAERILAALSRPIEYQQDSLLLTGSVGIVIADGVSTSETLIGFADAAMYKSKASGRGRYGFFDERMHHEVVARLSTEHKLRNAVESNQLQIYFQPVMTAKGKTPVAVQAQLRWAHPERGLLLPGDFMSLANETGAIVPMGTWLLAQACRWLQTWQTQQGMKVAPGLWLNLSSRQIAQPDFVQATQHIVTQAGIEPGRIQFNIKVSNIAEMCEPLVAAKTLEQLHACGFRIGLDGFGTEQAPLDCLKDYPADTIKLDQSFVCGATKHSVDAAIIRATSGLADALGICVAAEGVNTNAQAQLLSQAGVDLLQGDRFAIARRPEDMATRFLAE